MSSIEIIPLFPLGVVLLPEMTMPLHIFEERYKIMIGECLETQKEFGLVYYDGKNIKSIGCLARITEVIKKYSDGRMDIITKGSRRFNILEILEEKSYLQARIEFFDDHDLLSFQLNDEIFEKASKLLNDIAQLTNQRSPFSPSPLLKPQVLSFLIAGSDGFNYVEKQEFLEMKSTAERLKRGVEALTRILERIKINIEIRKLIDGNGHLPELLN